MFIGVLKKPYRAQDRPVVRRQSATQQLTLVQSLKGVALTTVGAQYFCMHVVVGGTPGWSTTLNMDRCQVKMGEGVDKRYYTGTMVVQ